MIFLCGMFVPIAKLPWFLKPLAFVLPPTYGVDMLRAALGGERMLPVVMDAAILGTLCLGLFGASLWNVRRKWIA